jgi:hypothetical protein
MSDTESDDDIRVTIHNPDSEFTNTITWTVGEFPPPGIQISGPSLSPFIIHETITNTRREIIETRLIEIAVQESIRDQENERKPEQIIDVNCVKYNPKKHDVGDDTGCSICHTEYVRGDDLSVLMCDHIFHTKCVEEWGMYKSECPLCRSEIPLIDEFSESESENIVA